MFVYWPLQCHPDSPGWNNHCWSHFGLWFRRGYPIILCPCLFRVHGVIIIWLHKMNLTFKGLDVLTDHIEIWIPGDAHQLYHICADKNKIWHIPETTFEGKNVNQDTWVMEPDKLEVLVTLEFGTQHLTQKFYIKPTADLLFVLTLLRTEQRVLHRIGDSAIFPSATPTTNFFKMITNDIFQGVPAVVPGVEVHSAAFWNQNKQYDYMSVLRRIKAKYLDPENELLRSYGFGVTRPLPLIPFYALDAIPGITYSHNLGAPPQSFWNYDRTKRVVTDEWIKARMLEACNVEQFVWADLIDAMECYRDGSPPHPNITRKQVESSIIRLLRMPCTTRPYLKDFMYHFKMMQSVDNWTRALPYPGDCEDNACAIFTIAMFFLFYEGTRCAEHDLIRACLAKMGLPVGICGDAMTPETHHKIGHMFVMLINYNRLKDFISVPEDWFYEQFDLDDPPLGESFVIETTIISSPHYSLDESHVIYPEQLPKPPLMWTEWTISRHLDLNNMLHFQSKRAFMDLGLATNSFFTFKDEKYMTIRDLLMESGGKMPFIPFKTPPRMEQEEEEIVRLFTRPIIPLEASAEDYFKVVPGALIENPDPPHYGLFKSHHVIYQYNLLPPAMKILRNFLKGKRYKVIDYGWCKAILFETQHKQ